MLAQLHDRLIDAGMSLGQGPRAEQREIGKNLNLKNITNIFGNAVPGDQQAVSAFQPGAVSSHPNGTSSGNLLLSDLKIFAHQSGLTGPLSKQAVLPPPGNETASGKIYKIDETTMLSPVIAFTSAHRELLIAEAKQRKIPISDYMANFESSYRQMVLQDEVGSSYKPDMDEAIQIANQRGLKIEGLSPKESAPYVHEQCGDKSCGVVAQQEIMAMLNIVPKDNPELVEKNLQQEAEHKFTALPWDSHAYAGALLVQNGVPIRKYDNGHTTEDDLIRALRHKKPLYVEVNPAILWNDEKRMKQPASVLHVILATSVARDPQTDRVLGFFINDSGDSVGGRFVVEKQFLDAWSNRIKFFIEPL